MARNIFNTIQVRKPKTSNFDMSHDLKLGMKMGTLTPVSVLECIPGDKWNIRTEVMLRMAPMVAPVMHNVTVTTHYFFVPNRLVWPNWEKFITDNNGKGNVPAPPMMNAITAEQAISGSLLDYLGLPIGKAIPAGKVSAIPFSAYQLIYNEYYRDQNLMPDLGKNGEGSIILGDGIQSTYKSDTLRFLRRRAWEHDYFTASLPFAQKGDAVDVPISFDNNVPIVINQTASPGSLAPIGSGPDAYVQRQNLDGANDAKLYAWTDGQENAEGDLTINNLRRAFRLQEWLEKMARGGSRYIEQVLVHFGVRSSDRRLDRPEYLGGNKQPVIISEVLQTSSSDETTPQGTMAGHGISASTGKNITYFCEEHGYIIGIMSIMPKTAYQQGIPKHFIRTSHLDYAWPTFAHIGEQEVLNKELYYDPADGKDDEVFGYVPRYSEYRYQPSRVAGDFRTSLNFWHLGRIFGTRPALNATFINCTPRNDIFAVKTDIQNVWGHCFHKIRVNRRLPKYGTPTL